MDAQQFLDEFGHIVSAPTGVQCLREMIYNLAITGDITRQFPEDGDARTLLQDIEIKRQSLIQSKQFKRTAKLESEPLLMPDSVRLPTSWCWTRLLDIGEISPRNEAKDDDPAAFIPMSGIPQLHNGNLAIETRTWGEIKKGFTHFANGDVVVAKITPCFENGKAAVISGLDNPQGIGAGTTELHVFRPIHSEVLSAYVYIFLRSPFFTVEGENNMTGTAGQKRLPTEYFATRAMPLPPFAEQERIVAKVDELMALCDKLETQQQQRRKLQNNLRLASLQAVAVATSPLDLKSAWQTLAENFSHLFLDPKDVTELRNLIMELSIHGLLTEQDPSEEPADALLHRIQFENEELIANGQLKRIKPLPPINNEDALFELPAGWAWARFPELGQFGRGKSKHRPRNDSRLFNPGIYPLVQTGEVARATRVIMEYHSKYSELGLAQSKIWEKGTLCITIAANIANAAILGFDACFPDSVVGFVPASEIREEVEYFLTFMETARARLLAFAPSTAQKNINLEILQSILIPIPPKEEMRRIIRRVRELMLICDRLEQELSTAKSIGGLLSTACVSAITGIHNEEEETLKTPKTELISTLCLVNNPDIKEQAPLAAILARHHNEMSAGDLWQRYGGEIDAFYAQLKQEVGKGWIAEPAIAQMREAEAG